MIFKLRDKRESRKRDDLLCIDYEDLMSETKIAMGPCNYDIYFAMSFLQTFTNYKNEHPDLDMSDDDAVGEVIDRLYEILRSNYEQLVKSQGLETSHASLYCFFQKGEMIIKALDFWLSSGAIHSGYESALQIVPVDEKPSVRCSEKMDDFQLKKVNFLLENPADFANRFVENNVLLVVENSKQRKEFVRYFLEILGFDYSTAKSIYRTIVNENGDTQYWTLKFTFENELFYSFSNDFDDLIQLQQIYNDMEVVQDISSLELKALKQASLRTLCDAEIN